MLSLTLLATSALAQSGGLDAHGFDVAGDQARGTLQLHAADIGHAGAWNAGVVFDHADDPLVETIGETERPILDQVLTANIAAGMNVGGVARVDVVAPYTLLGEDQQGSFSSPGDLRVEGKIPLLSGGLGLSMVPAIWAPTGAADRFLGNDGAGFGATLAASQSLGSFDVVLNLGGRAGPQTSVRNVTWGTAVVGGLGTSMALDPRTRAGLELRALASLETDSGAGTPAEVVAHLRHQLPGGLWAMAGGGAGITDGVGASSVRLVTGFGYSFGGQEPEPAGPLDTDLDGIVDAEDECPDRPEDIDEVHDLDGCPDIDDDNDGIVDARDLCHFEAEDIDGDRDNDGCPDYDLDRDGVADNIDRCPTEAILPGQDPATSDGCPELAAVSGDKIIITQKIYFEEGSARILADSRPVLEAVHAVLIQHPEISDVLIEGHTNDTGGEAYNYRLSDARARAVMDWLVAQGIDRNRIAAKGYGESRPLLGGDTDDARTQNRRVEFSILRKIDS